MLGWILSLLGQKGETQGQGTTQQGRPGYYSQFYRQVPDLYTNPQQYTPFKGTFIAKPDKGFRLEDSPFGGGGTDMMARVGSPKTLPEILAEIALRIGDGRAA